VVFKGAQPGVSAERESSGGRERKRTGSRRGAERDFLSLVNDFGCIYQPTTHTHTHTHTHAHTPTTSTSSTAPLKACVRLSQSPSHQGQTMQPRDFPRDWPHLQVCLCPPSIPYPSLPVCLSLCALHLPRTPYLDGRIQCPALSLSFCPMITSLGPTSSR
jgi:hypothetical protein